MSRNGPLGGASLTALGWATANRGVLGGPIRWPARDYLLCCLTVIVRNCSCIM